MAARVLEFAAAPRPCSSFFPKPMSPTTTVWATSSISSGRRQLGRLLPQFSGLRVSKSAMKSEKVVYGGTKRVVSHRRGVVCEAQDTAIDVPDVTTTTWQPMVMESDTTVLVEFWAPWCGPCRMILPLIGELSKQYTGKLKCLKLNTDDCPDIATKYGIRSIPTIVIFSNGEKIDSVVGALQKDQLTVFIDKLLLEN